jgi:hypothetical protein
MLSDSSVAAPYNHKRGINNLSIKGICHMEDTAASLTRI